MRSTAPRRPAPRLDRSIEIHDDNTRSLQPSGTQKTLNPEGTFLRAGQTRPIKRSFSPPKNIWKITALNFPFLRPRPAPTQSLLDKSIPIGRPTPENSAGGNARLARDSLGSSDEDADHHRLTNAAAPVTSPRAPDPAVASPRPWLAAHATGRRSNRARVVNDSFCQRFEAAEAAKTTSTAPHPRVLGLPMTCTENVKPRREESPGIVKPQPHRGSIALNLDDTRAPSLINLDDTRAQHPGALINPRLIHAPEPGKLAVPLPPHLTAAVLAEAGRPATATPPPHLVGTVQSAAELLIGSPGAGMAAADTLLSMLMMGPADSPSIEKGASPATVKAACSAAVAAVTKTARGAAARRFGNTNGRTGSSLAPKKRPRSGSPDPQRGTAKKGKLADPPVEFWAGLDGERIVPETAMYTAASNAAAKRRMLPSRGGGRQKVHRPWTLPEVEALVEGVGHYGRGQWADIKALERDGVAAALESRTAVDLKDKWRNLLRIAMLPVLYKRREATEMPPALLAKVRELAARTGSPTRGGGGGGGGGDAGESSPGTDDDGANASDASMPASKGARRSKHHSPWTLTESEALVAGVESCAGCRWTVIKKLGLESLERRTAMDLKDKWRNLLQLASLPQQSRRKAETPPELLQRVLWLEAEYGTARRKGRKSADEKSAE